MRTCLFCENAANSKEDAPLSGLFNASAKTPILGPNIGAVLRPRPRDGQDKVSGQDESLRNLTRRFSAGVPPWTSLNFWVAIRYLFAYGSSLVRSLSQTHESERECARGVETYSAGLYFRGLRATVGGLRCLSPNKARLESLRSEADSRRQPFSWIEKTCRGNRISRGVTRVALSGRRKRPSIRKYSPSFSTRSGLNAPRPICFLPALQKKIGRDDRELRGAGTQPQLGTRPCHSILAGYGFLQAADVAVHLEALPENAGLVFAVQPHFFGTSGGHVRNSGDCRAVGTRAKTALSKIGTGLAGR